MADGSLVEQVTPFLASGVVAISAGWAGARWQRRGGHDAWLRERRLESYSRLLAHSHAFNEHISEAWAPYEAAPYLDSMRAAARDLTGVFAAASEVRILGSTLVIDAVEPYLQAHSDLFDLVRDLEEGPRPVEWIHDCDEHQTLDAAQTVFQTAAQNAIQR